MDNIMTFSSICEDFDVYE